MKRLDLPSSMPWVPVGPLILAETSYGVYSPLTGDPANSPVPFLKTAALTVVPTATVSSDTQEVLGD